MRHFDQAHFETASAAPILTTEAYVRLLHPEHAIGKTTLMAKDATGRAHSKTYTLATAPVLASNFLDGDGYISLHRFHGPRKISQLAALNGLFLDLDIDRLPHGASRSVGAWSLDMTMHCLSLKLPPPTVLLFTGRGLAAIWLIKPLPPKALPRWQEAQNVLIDHFRSLGADPACRDAARVTRLPGSLNSKSQKIASIIDGTLERYDFDQLADDIYIAAGRPTREELKHRQVRRKQRAARKQSGGLPARARFSAVLRDLDRLRLSWGGQVPVGARNTWLHLYATCLSHTFGAAEIPERVQAMAAEATPGLSPSEVSGVARIAARHAALPKSGASLTDGRYHYAGATIADMLGVTAAGARTLGLEQIMPTCERARRKAERERQRRRTAGAMSRETWLEENTREARQPWVNLSISRSTYYRRLKAGEIVDTTEPASAPHVETGPCPQQGGSALPEAPAEGRSPAGKGPTPTQSPSRRTRPAQRKSQEIEKPHRAGLYEVVVECNSQVHSPHQQGEIDFARQRIYYPLERVRRE
jgi:hypothetical protein